MILVTLVAATHAQSCSCQVGGGDGGLPPMALGITPWGGSVGLAGNLGSTGHDAWTGLYVEDRRGNSMPEMAMPGHLVTSGRLSLAVGLPGHLSVSASSHYDHSHPWSPSDMIGDVDQSFLGDTSLSMAGTWARSAVSVAPSLGLSAPTGRVVDGYGVRGGRGAWATSAGLAAVVALSPWVRLSGAASTTANLGVDATGWRVGPSWSTSVGPWAWTRENGPIAAGAFLVLRGNGHDRREELVYEETGVTVLDLGAGLHTRLYKEKNRTAALDLRLRTPLVQVVGDPWLAENGSLDLGATFAW